MQPALSAHHTIGMTPQDTLLWQPDTLRIQRSHLQRFAHWAANHCGAPAPQPDWPQYWPQYWPLLWQWSVDHRETFWTAVLRYADLLVEGELEPALLQRDAMPGAQWFPGLRLNYAENLLRGSADQQVVVSADERGQRSSLSRSALRAQVAGIAAALREHNIGPGDVVAGYLPNGIEALVAMLAATSLGAVWTSTSPDFGLEGAAERFGQVQAKVLFACDRHVHAGEPYDNLAIVAVLQQRLPHLRQLVMVPCAGNAQNLPALPGAVTWQQVLEQHAKHTEPQYTRLPFDAPLFILYSSGTTGKPKCIVHGIGGSLLQHVKEHLLHVDLHAGDTLCYYTTCGWMMWNWQVSALAVGATVVLYDGSPVHPRRDRLWELVAQEGITHLGVSPRYLSLQARSTKPPTQGHDLQRLRTLLSTGSPLGAEQFDFVYQHIKADLHLASISGGTDILSCFCLGVACLPVHRGQLQAAGLGMAAAVWTEQGQPVTGERGELVCTVPFPSMPTGFVNDQDGSRYHAAYFEKFAQVWHHGDYAVATAEGGFVLLGRSDATLNPGGVRIGTAEIYRQIEHIDEVVDAVVIGQQRDMDERIVLFVVLRSGLSLDLPLQQRIREQIRHNTSPRHVPARIVQVDEVPRTRSGKIVELAVRDVVHARPVVNLQAIANPQCLDQYRDRPELRS